MILMTIVSMMVGLMWFTKPMLDDDALFDIVLWRILRILPLHFMEDNEALMMIVDVVMTLDAS